MNRPDKVAIDFDLIAYKSAAAVETTSIIVTNLLTDESMTFGTRTEFYGHHAKKAGGWLAETNAELEAAGDTLLDVEEFSILDKVDVGTLEEACDTANNMIASIVAGCGVKDYVGVMDGTGNFRRAAATILKYKDRPSNGAPVHHEALEEYLIANRKGYKVDHIEADDELSILASSGEYIQATIDKDAAQTVGWWYNWDKMDEPIEVTDGCGRLAKNSKNKVTGVGFKFLMHQMLFGDSIDTIKPRELCGVRFGETGSFNLLDPIESKADCLQAVLDKYMEWYPEPVTYPHCNGSGDITKDYFEIASEMFTLLYMLRSRGDDRTLTDVCEQLGLGDVL